MTRFLLAALVLALVGCTDDLTPRERPPEVGSTAIPAVTFDTVFVVNGEDATISVIDAERNVVAGTIKLTGIAYPHHVSLSPDRTMLGLAVPGYDMSNGQFGHEHHSSRPGKVLLLDALTGGFRAVKATDAANTNVVFAPEGHQIWTSQATLPSGSTLVFDAHTLELKDAIMVGTSPAGTVIAPDGKLAYVANAGSSSVSVIDVASRVVKATIAVGAGPVYVQPTSDGMVYVENEPDHSVSVIDSATLRVSRTFRLGYRPGSIAVPMAGEVWVMAPERGVVEVRNQTGAVLQTIPTGNGAHCAVFSADGKRAYVSNEWENSVSVIDRDTKVAIAKLEVGAKPNGMVWRSR